MKKILFIICILFCISSCTKTREEYALEFTYTVGNNHLRFKDKVDYFPTLMCSKTEGKYRLDIYDINGLHRRCIQEGYLPITIDSVASIEKVSAYRINGWNGKRID